RSKGADWQVWIEVGPRPLPCRYVVDDVSVAQVPEQEVILAGWDESPSLPPGWFTFAPANGARRLEFLPPQVGAVAGRTIETLPGNCAKRTHARVLYYRCGDAWYRPYYLGPDLIYAQVAAPGA